MLKPVRVVEPFSTPVTLDEAKAHLRVDHADDDSLINAYIAAATAYLEGWSGVLGGRALITQTWSQSYQTFPIDEVIGLAITPVKSITSVTYYDAEGTFQTLAAGAYTFLTDQLGAYVTLQVDEVWPAVAGRPDAMAVTYVAGYGPNPADVPADIRQIILLMVGDWYDHRANVVSGVSAAEVPMGAPVRALLSRYSSPVH